MSHLLLFALDGQLKSGQFAVSPADVAVVIAACIQDGVEFVVAVHLVEQPDDILAELVSQSTVLGLRAAQPSRPGRAITSGQLYSVQLE